MRGPAAARSIVASTRPPLCAPAAATARPKRAMTSLTRTSLAGSALSRESSLLGSKRLKRRCHASRRRSAVRTACAALVPGTSPSTCTVQVDPKHAKLALASLTTAGW
jgi:hypothetical protein